MNVFISWSGEKSRVLGNVLNTWLPSVIQAVNPYFSPEDIEKGTKWSNEILKQLESSDVGLLCVTSDNYTSPWLLFEAGALAKSLDKSRVIPILLEVEPTEITGPLIQLQAAKMEKNEIKKVVKTINASQEEASLGENVLDNVFETFWPQFEETLKAGLINLQEDEKKIERSDREILIEILELAREFPKSGSQISRLGLSDVIRSFSIEIEVLYESNIMDLSKVSEFELISALGKIGSKLSKAARSSKDSAYLTRSLRKIEEISNTFSPF